MTNKDRLAIMMSETLVRKLREAQADKQRKSTKSVSFSWMVGYCIASKKTFNVKDSAYKVRITITIDNKILKKIRSTQADKQMKSEKSVSLSGVIASLLIS